MSPMPYLFWEKKISSTPSKSSISRGTFSTVGTGFYWGNKSKFSGKHRWIITTTNYFSKWIEAIPTRRATDAMIMEFLEENILARFGCPRRIVTDNAAAFKYKKMVSFVTSIILVLIIILLTIHRVMD